MWSWIVDSVVYMLLFLTASGIYLFVFIKAERKVGLAFLGAGCFSFWTILLLLLV